MARSRRDDIDVQRESDPVISAFKAPLLSLGPCLVDTAPGLGTVDIVASTRCSVNTTAPERRLCPTNACYGTGEPPIDGTYSAR